MIGLTAISAGAKLLFGVLCYHAGKDGVCFPNQTSLAEEIGCSVRSVGSYVEELETSKFIERSREGKSAASPFSYSFVWHECLESCLRKDNGSAKIAESPRSAKIADPVQQDLPNEHAKFAEPPYKVLRESLTEESKENITPVIPSEELEDIIDLVNDNSEEFAELTIDNISEWIENLFHDMRMQGHDHVSVLRNHYWLSGKERKKLMALAEQDGKDALRRKIEAFIDSGGKTPADFLRQMPGAYPKQSLRKDTYRGSVVRERRSEDSEPPPRRTMQPAAFVRDSHNTASRDLVERWNAVVPEWRRVPLEGSAKGYSVATLQQAAMDGEFLAAYPRVLEKAAAILKAKGTGASWLSFGWLFAVKESGPNWGKLARGDLDGFAAEAASTPQAKQSEAMKNQAELIRKLKSGEVKA